MTRRARYSATVVILMVVLTGYLFYLHGRSVWVPLVKNMTGKRSVDEVVDLLGVSARARLQPYFDSAGVRYPPRDVTLLALKDSARLELWVDTNNGPVHIRDFKIEALSGHRGPKLREGDRQVPEGIYRIDALNPNSSYHLSMKLNYPNAFDRRHARQENRSEPGSNIFIHGKAVSIGCLAMGDTAIEALFVLAADVGMQHIKVVIAPSDPRLNTLSFVGPQTWGAALYAMIDKEFRHYVENRI